MAKSKQTAVATVDEVLEKTPNHAVVVRENQEMSGMLSLIERVIMDPSIDVAKLDALLAVKSKWEAEEARKEFVAAMAEFKKDPPVIYKSKRVFFRARDPNKGETDYMHATIGAVTEAIIGGLASVGISHSWDVKQESNVITVTCKLTHRRGHSESVTMIGAPDDSGNKNQLQKVASTVTYLQRYTLLAATGIATHDQRDNDGADAGEEGEEGSATITVDQAIVIQDKVREANLNPTIFMKHLSKKAGRELKTVEELPARFYKEVVGAIDDRIREKQRVDRENAR